MTQEQYNTLEERIDKIHDYLNIEGKRMQLVEYKLRSADPNIYKPENEKNRDFISLARYYFTTPLRIINVIRKYNF